MVTKRLKIESCVTKYLNLVINYWFLSIALRISPARFKQIVNKLKKYKTYYFLFSKRWERKKHCFTVWAKYINVIKVSGFSNCQTKQREVVGVSLF